MGRIVFWLRNRRPVTLVVLGYSFYILCGFVLLCLPFAHAQPGLSPLDHLFIATSAVSTTGLATISPGAAIASSGRL